MAASPLQCFGFETSDLVDKETSCVQTQGHSHDRIEMGRCATPLGPMIVGIEVNQSGAEQLAMLEFTDRHKLDSQLKILATKTGSLIMPVGAQTSALAFELHEQLDAYFTGRLTVFDLPLAIHGTAFQIQVWQALREIPSGETRSYADIATTVGRPSATRAVGTTNAKNRLAIVIPCHRVVRTDGSLSGYAGGIWRKQALLDLESGTAC